MRPPAHPRAGRVQDAALATPSQHPGSSRATTRSDASHHPQRLVHEPRLELDSHHLKLGSCDAQRRFLARPSAWTTKRHSRTRSAGFAWYSPAYPASAQRLASGMGSRGVDDRSRALGASELRQVRKEAAPRTPSEVPRFRPIRAGDADSSGDTALDEERVADRHSVVCRRTRSGADFHARPPRHAGSQSRRSDPLSSRRCDRLALALA